MDRNNRTSYSGDSISYTFFRERTRRPKVEVSPARSDGSRLGFQVVVQRNGIHCPSANCKGTQYNFERQDHNGEIDFLQIGAHYFVYPFVINQDASKGTYIIIQRNSRLGEVCKFDDTDTIHAPICISGVGFEMKKDYVLKTNLSELQTKRLNLNELAEHVILSLEEIKEPSLVRRFLSLFGVTRTRIPK